MSYFTQRLPYFYSVVACIAMFSQPQFCLAQEPKPAGLTLKQLIDEANNKNPEVREAQSRKDAASARASQAWSPFLPELGLEGGYESWQGAKESDDRIRGSFGYAFGRYNLFRGGRDYFRLKTRSRDAGFEGIALEKTQAKIAREVASDYYQLLYLDQALALKENALQLNRDQITHAEKRVRSGLVSKADTLEFTLRDSSLRSDLLLLQQERDAAERELRQKLGRTDSAPISVQGTLSPGSIAQQSAEEALQAALSQRLDLKAAERDYEVASLEYTATLGEWLPEINLEGHFGTLQKTERELETSPSSAIILKATLPLFSGLSSYNERRARSAERSQADARVLSLRLQTKAQVETALSRMQAIRDRLELESKNVARAKDYYDVTHSEYIRGVKNSPDLAGATERLYESRQRLIELQRDFHLARLNYAEQIGISAPLE